MMPHRVMQKRLSTGYGNALDNAGKLRPTGSPDDLKA